MAIDLDGRLMILREIAEAWLALRKALRTLSEHELVASGTVGSWSFKDLMAHITIRERVLMQRIRALEQGQDTSELDALDEAIDAFSADAVRRQAEKPIDEVREEFDRTHAELMELLEVTPVLSRELVAGATFEHYREHLQHVLAYMGSRGSGRRKRLE
jgi:hypothetical protein